ncbi:MAG: hypothetical protein U5K74_05850 [Gemmatimonadaceae bacterium]|nr:hypothetical protein [Gemmatimonadaceae bacterium]
MPRPLSRVVALVIAALAAAVPCRAQAAPAPTDTALPRCIGQRITRISIEPIGPEFGGKSASSRLVTGLVRKFHVDSRRRVIQEFVQLKEGGICTEINRRETERVLRAQWFIQDARVLVYPDEDGVQLIVTTVDEVAMIAGLQFSGTNVRQASIGNSNFLGRGLLFEAGWRSNGALRDGRTLRLRSAITFGRPIQTNLTWNRFGLGNRADIEFRYPFLTDLQRYGFRAILGKDDDYVRFVRPVGSLPLQRVSRTFGSLGGVARIGRPGALLLAGGSLSYDDENIGETVIVTDSGAIAFPETRPQLPAPPRTATRMNLLFGGRAMRFLPVEGFDALTGVQDLRIGVQFGGQFGRPLKLDGLRSDDYFLAGDIYAGWGNPTTFFGTEWIFSGRKANQAGWDGRLISGRTAAYYKPTKKSTSIASLEFTGGNDVRVPFQVPLNSTRFGVRGYRGSLDGGETRLVMRAEQRQAMGRPWGFGDIGAVVFGESGKIWAGKAPYGITSPWRSSIGTGVLLAVPPRSRRLYRLDVAYALAPDLNSKRWEVRVSSGNFTRTFWQDPDESRRARERSLITNLFSF